MKVKTKVRAGNTRISVCQVLGGPRFLKPLPLAPAIQAIK